ncbi:MAG TPA: hypothetical protein VFD70_07405 [Anaerolineae bacterium]|nr:hypothetical protein [Anaerolineae bacterium]
MKRWLAFGAIAVGLVLNALWFFNAIGGEPVDDAYISYVYARNALLGHGLTFNPSERVEGFTNFLWTAMMTPVVASGLDVGRVSSALGVLFAIGVLFLVVRLARWLGVAEIVGWMAALFLAVDGSFALWGVSGLETPLFAFLLTLGVFLYLKENFSSLSLVPHASSLASRHAHAPPTNSRFPAGNRTTCGLGPSSGLVFALAALTRPEAAAVFALTVGHQAAWRIIDQRKLVTRGDLVRIASFVIVFVPYWLIRWRYYHSFLPNSFYAKVSIGGPLAQIERGWNHVQQFVGVHLTWLILLPALLALIVVTARYLRTRRHADANASDTRRAFFGFTYFAALVIAYCVYIIYVGGDWSVGRFFVPILPFAYLLIAEGAYFILQVASLQSGTAVAAALLLSIALWFASAYNGEFRIFIGGFDAARATEARIAAGKWLKANVPAGTWIAVDAAGQVPYFSELPAIDMFGINDLHIGRMPVATLGQGTPGHEKFDLGYIIARAPQYVIIYGTLFDNVSEYRRASVQWTNDPALENFLTIYERVR